MQTLAALFRRRQANPLVPLDRQLIGPRVVLRLADAEDWKAWSTLRETSRAYLEPWEPLWPPHALTYSFFCSLLRRQWRDWRQGRAYAFSIFLHTGPQQVLVGGITLSDVRYASAQKGTVGYWIGQPFSGQGLMGEALQLVCDFAFRSLHPERIEASCLPRNEVSKAVLVRAGFEQEGYAKAYLQINGVREDHILWGKNNPALEACAPTRH